jgi:hypothetical protein
LVIEAFYAKQIPVDGIKCTLRYIFTELLDSLQNVDANNIIFDKHIDYLDKKKFSDDLIRLCFMYSDSLKSMYNDVKVNSPKYNKIYDRSLDITIFMAEKVIANMPLKKSSYDEIRKILSSDFYCKYVKNITQELHPNLGGIVNFLSKK